MCEKPLVDPPSKEFCDSVGGRFVGGAEYTDDPPPCPICEIAGASSCQHPELGAGDYDWATMSDQSTPPPTFWAATLECSTPHFDDWTQYGVVHAYDAGIIPGAIYEIQAISDGCNLGDELAYSDPVQIVMSSFGDVVGDCGIQPCSPPQGVIDFIDITAAVDKFRNLPTAVQKARADVINNNTATPVPDRKVDFVDISSVAEAFRGSPPPLPGPQQRCP